MLFLKLLRCDKCNGKGKIYKSKCHVCSGHKVRFNLEIVGRFL